MKSRIITYKNYRFINYLNTLIPYESPSKKINLSKKEAIALLKKTGAYLIRWHTDFDINKETYFWFVIKDIKEDLNDYKSKYRNQIKRGLDNCDVKRVSKDFVAENAYKIYKSAFISYETDRILISENDFKKEIYKSSSNNDDYWCVFKKNTNQILAYAKCIIQDDSVNYTLMKFNPKYKSKLYTGYAIVYAMNKYYLEKFSFVNDGARSMVHDTNIQTFLESKFKFRKSYCNLHVVFMPKINFLISVVYIFRKIIYKCNNKLCKKISVLLRHKEFSV